LIVNIKKRERIRAAMQFYRSAVRVDTRARSKPVRPVQLAFNFESDPRYFSDAACPLKDLFPMAYPDQ
jgi:hypothetical protein